MQSNKEKRSPNSSAYNKGNAKKRGKGGVLPAVTSRTPSDDKASLCAIRAEKTHPTKSDAEAKGIGSSLVSSQPNDATKGKPSTAAVETGAIKSDVETERDNKLRTSCQQPGGQEQPRDSGNDGAKSPSPQDVVGNQPAVHDSAESSFTTASSNAEDGGQKEASSKKETSIIPTLFLSPVSMLSDSKKSSKPEDEAKGEGQRAASGRHSTTTAKRDNRTPVSKKRNKKREAPGQNKAVQATLPETTAAAGPPIHVLLTPSSCGLCDNNSRTLHASQFNRSAGMGAISARTSGKKVPRGIIKKTVTTTRRVKHGRRNSLDDDEDTTKEVMEVVGGTDVPLPKQEPDSAVGRAPVVSSSVSGKIADDGVIKKTVTTTRRRKGVDKYERNSDSADVIEETITEVIGQAHNEDKQHTEDGDSKTGRTALSPSPTDKTTGALQKAVKTTHRPKNRGKRDDSYETVTTEVVELCDDATLEEPNVRSVQPRTISGVVRDASTTQYSYAERRRPAFASGQSPLWAGPWNPRMRFRPPGLWANPIYRRSMTPECPIHQHGTARHIPGCPLAAVSQRMSVPSGAAWGMLPGCRAHLPAHSQTCLEGHLGPFFCGHAMHAPICSPSSASPCCGQPRTQCVLHDDSHTRSPPCDCCAAAPSLAPNGCAGILEERDDVSEGTYDVLYYAEPAEREAEDAGFVPGGAADRPTDVIWETPPRDEFFYYSRNSLAAAPPPPSLMATHRHGSGIDDSAAGRGQDHAHARAARAVTDVGQSGRRQVTRHSTEEAVPFFYLS
ncbi:uncharacterized protein LOC144130069 [Amblyomma americanum]